MWFVLTSVGTITTLIIIVSLWEKFQTNPTITGLDTDFHNWEVPFPTVTLCPDDPTNETLINNFIQRLVWFETMQIENKRLTTSDAVLISLIIFMPDHFYTFYLHYTRSRDKNVINVVRMHGRGDSLLGVHLAYPKGAKGIWGTE